MIRHAKATVALLATLVALLALGGTQATAMQTHPQGPDADPTGSPNGFQLLSGLAFDPTGEDLYAYDLQGAGSPIEFTAAAHVLNASSQPATWQSQLSGQNTPQGQIGFSQPADVAVDASGTASQGNVYLTDASAGVVDAFDPNNQNQLLTSFGDTEGGSDGQLHGNASQIEGFGQPCGLAVDQANGDLYVADSTKNRIWIFTSEGSFKGKVADSSLNGPCGIALNSSGDLYVENSIDGKVLRFNRSAPADYEFAATIYTPNPEAGDPPATDVAVDSSNDHLYVDEGSRVGHFDDAGNLIVNFGEGILSGSSAGIAIDPATGAVYVADNNAIHSFGALITLPDPSTGDVANVAETTATLQGAIDPAGGPEADCHFEYGTDQSYGQSAPCEPAGPFSTATPVSADLSGLQPGTTYHYRIVGSNVDGERVGQDRSFATLGPPLVFNNMVATDVTTDAAVLHANINPSGAPTAYRFEYVEAAEFEVSGFANAVKAPLPDAELGAGTSVIAVSEAINGLKPATGYRYRVVAENASGTTAGDSKEFTTFAPPTQVVPGQFPGQGFLPDDRAWEMVTPPDKNGGYVRGLGNANAVSEDGNRLGYAALGNYADTQGTGVAGSTQYVAVRGASGWTSYAVTPRGNYGFSQALSGTTFSHYSSDLTRTTVSAFDLDYVDNDIPEGLPNLYRGAVGTSELLPVSKPLAGPVPLGARARFIDGSANFDHIVFASSAKLVSAVPGTETPVPDGGTKIYDWHEGTLTVAGVLPDGTVPSQGANSMITADGLSNRGTVSPDGSRILFRSPANEPSQLYMRKDATSTAWISEPELPGPSFEPEDVRFEVASPTVEKVAFSTESRLTEEDPGGPGHAVYVYTDSDDPENETNLEFVARVEGKAAVDGMSPDGGAGVFFDESLGQLYRWEGDSVHLVTNDAEGLNWGPVHRSVAEINQFIGVNTSTDARRIAFVSQRQLTDNDLGVVNSSHGSFPSAAIYVYDTDTDELLCASCPPTHAVTTSNASITPMSRDEPFGINGSQVPRFMSGDGRLVFFSTADALVPEDTNGKQDAYSYDVETRKAHLLSSGHSNRDSWFAAVSADGSNAFILTNERLTGWDRDTLKDMYVARVGGGLPEPPVPGQSCQGDACQPPPVELNDPTPASAALHAPGQRTNRHGRPRCRKQRAKAKKRCARHKRHKRAGKAPSSRAKQRSGK